MSTPDEKLVQKPKSNAAMFAVVAIVLIIVLVAVIGWQAGWFQPSHNTNPGPSMAACSYSSSGDPTGAGSPAGQSLTAAGSTFVYPLMYTWEVDYAAATISYGSVGSGTGITYLGQKTIDFAASDAPLSPAQQATDPNVIQMPESAGAVSIIYNLPGISVPVNFNGTILANIFLGTVTMWNDPSLIAINPGVSLPASSIVVVHRQDGSGTTFAFTKYLSSESPKWNTTIGFATKVNWTLGTGASGSGTLASTVQTTPYAIGYVDLEYALANGVGYGKVQNPAGNYILPSLNTTTNAIKDHTGALPIGTDAKDWYNVSIENEPGANDYPISTFTYLMAYQELSTLSTKSIPFSLQQAQSLVTFWNWTIHYGQSYSATLYYVPLPANIVMADQSELALFTYSGAAVPHC